MTDKTTSGFHKIEIPQRVIDRLMARRPSLHVYDTIDPRKTALFVIDMQNCFVETGACLELPGAPLIIDNINALAAAIRQAGGQVVWTLHRFQPQRSIWYNHMVAGEWRERVFTEAGDGRWGKHLSAKLDVDERDWQVEKTQYSALFPGATTPDLTTQLRERGIERLLITGVLTNACCEATARDANAIGFELVMISDAMATHSDAEHNMTLCNALSMWGDVHTTADQLAMIERARGSSNGA